MPVTVAAVADATLVRFGVAAALHPHADLRLVAAVGGAADAEPLLERLRPDVVLLDSELSDGDGLTYGSRLRRQRPDLGVVLLAPRDDDLLLRALESGISAYVPRSSAIEGLLAALRHAAVAPSSFTAGDLAAAIARRGRQATALSARERDVLRLLCEGLSAPRMAVQLRVTESTVKTYLARVYDKLGVHSRAEAMVVATRRGLLATDGPDSASA